jgi:hypothetical protein
VTARARRVLAALAVAAAAVVLLPGPSAAQVFFASRPHPEFSVGPLFVRAAVTPALGATTVDVLFSLVVPPRQSGADLEQDIYLLWPGGVRGTPGERDPALGRFAESRGFEVVASGTVPLFARSLYAPRGQSREEPIPGGAPFVSFVHDVGAIERSTPVTWIRIPWTPRLVNRVWLMDLRLTVEGLIQPKAGNWLDRVFTGPRHRIVLTFHDVRGRAAFPLYLEHRDRVIRLSEDPAQILLRFSDSDRLKIDELAPPSASRRQSERRAVEIVSLYLDRSDGLTPQALTVQFGYYTALQTWAPILIPMLFFVAGNVAAVLVRNLAERLSRIVSARLSFGRPGHETPRGDGVILPRETLTRLVPVETTYEDVLRLCGPASEEREDVRGGHRTLVYRGRRVVPQRRRSFGWIGTVSHWDVEHHEVDVSFDDHRVRDVQARVRRSRLPAPEERT